MSNALIDHLEHHVVSDEAELRRYPVTLIYVQGMDKPVVEVNHADEGEWIDDIRVPDLTGLYCTTCDMELENR